MAAESGSETRERGRPIVLPLLLIALGVTLLLVNLGYLSWADLRALVLYWPVIFILLGAEALLTRRVPWGALLLALVVLVGFSAGGWVHALPTTGAARPMASAHRTQGLDGAARAMVSFTAGGTQLLVNELSEPGLLARWDGVEVDSKASYRVRDGLGRLELDLSRGRSLPSFVPGIAEPGMTDSSRVTHLQLSTGVPLELEGRVGASDATLDLRALNVNRLSLDAGASNTTLYLSDRSERASATVRGGASNVLIVIPEGVNARIRPEGGLSSIRVDPARFTSSQTGGGEYRTLSPDGSGRTLELSLRLGAASVEIR